MTETVEPTTPRDAIGLSERLRKHNISDDDGSIYMIDNRTACEAATALDALQARVKELEGELVDTQAALTGVNSDWAKAESRATRAEQERDEAYERLKPFAKAGELFQTREPEDYDQCVYAPAAGSEYNLTASHLRAARDLVRRLAAGTEKEGK